MRVDQSLKSSRGLFHLFKYYFESKTACSFLRSFLIVDVGCILFCFLSLLLPLTWLLTSVPYPFHVCLLLTPFNFTGTEDNFLYAIIIKSFPLVRLWAKPKCFSTMSCKYANTSCNPMLLLYILVKCEAESGWVISSKPQCILAILRLVNNSSPKGCD